MTKMEAYKLMFKDYPDVVGTFYNPGVGVGYAFGINLVCTSSITVLFWPEFTGFRYKFDFKLWKQIMKYSFPMLILGIVGILNQTIDKIIFPFVYDGPEQLARAELGIYGAASKIAMVMAMLMQAFRFAYEPFVFGNAAFGAQNIQTFITFHNVADLADLAADAETGMLRHIITSYFYVSIQKQFS